MPMLVVKSKCPSQPRSTPATAMIASALAIPAAVSISAMTSVRSLASLNFCTTSAAAVVIMGHAEGDTAHAFRAVAAPGGDLLRLRRALDHRDHNAHCAGIEHGRDQVVMAAGHADHGHDPEPAGGGDLHLDRLNTGT